MTWKITFAITHAVISKRSKNVVFFIYLDVRICCSSHNDFIQEPTVRRLLRDASR